MRIRTKLLLITFLAAAGSALSLGLMFFSRETLRQYQELERGGLRASASARQLAADLKEILITENLKLAVDAAYGNLENVNREIEGFLASETLDRLAGMKGLEESVRTLRANWGLMDRYLNEAKTKMTEILGPDLDGRRGIISLMYDETTKAAFFIFSPINAAGVYVRDAFLVNFDHLTKALAEEIAARERRMILLMTAVSAAAVVFILLFISSFSRSVVRRLSYIESGMKRVAERDFTAAVEIRGRDEIGTLAGYMNRTVERLKEVFASVKTVSRHSREQNDAITQAMTEFSATLTEIAAAVSSARSQFNELAEQIQESSASLDQIGRTVDHLSGEIETQAAAVTQSSASMEEVARSIESVNAITQARSESAAGLTAAIRDGETRMQEADEAVRQTLTTAEKIHEIVGIIDAVAAQTNLLAMNAAIEAAHAGESGRGFAVVAEEIRKLAESTSVNSKSIRQSVQEITRGVIAASEASSRNAEFFGTVSAEVDRFASAFTEISSMLAEMAAGTHQVLDASTTLGGITQRIRDGFSEIHSGVRNITAAMETVTLISAKTAEGMSEIDTGTGTLRDTMSELAGRQETSRESVEALDRELESFRT